VEASCERQWSSSDFCDPFGFCQDWLHQLELTAGVLVRF
jgi:hypothetical protein